MRSATGVCVDMDPSSSTAGPAWTAAAGLPVALACGVREAVARLAAVTRAAAAASALDLYRYRRE